MHWLPYDHEAFKQKQLAEQYRQFAALPLPQHTSPKYRPHHSTPILSVPWAAEHDDNSIEMHSLTLAEDSVVLQAGVGSLRYNNKPQDSTTGLNAIIIGKKA